MTIVDAAAATAEQERLAALGRSLVSLRRRRGAEALRDVLSTLDAQHLADAEQAMAMVEREATMGAEAAAEWRANPATMANHLSGGRYQLFPYVELLGKQFKKAETGESKRQIWIVPAQYGKSTLASQWGPAWYLDQHPDHRLILTSYGDMLADTNALAVRDILRTHASALRTSVRRDASRIDRFLTPDGGGILAAGIDSTMTGFPAHGVVIDDPFKNWVDAHSAARRERVWNQYRSVIRLRQTWDNFWIILVATRWHTDDLTGKLVHEWLKSDGEEWEVIRLAEVAEEPDATSSDYFTKLPDPLGRPPGQILERRRFNEESVSLRRRSAGPYLWAGMHQGRPAPAEGKMLKRAWWQVVEILPPAFDQCIASWDMKLKEKKTGDYQSGQVWGRTGGSVWLKEHLHGQWNLPTVSCAIALLQIRHPEIGAHVIENTGNGPEVMEELRRAVPDYVLSDEIANELGMTVDEREKVQQLRRRGMSGLIPWTPKGDKVARAMSYTGMLEAGDVHVLDNEGGRALIDQASSFPDVHDDMVDSWSQAMMYLRHGEASFEMPDPEQRIVTQGPAERGAGGVGAPSGVIDPRARLMPRGARLGDIRRDR